KLPMDDYLEYAVKEAFKTARPVWMEILTRDSSFLKDEPFITELLLGPLRTPENLNLPGFLKTDPEWIKYTWPPLSTEEIEKLKNSTAVIRFLERSGSTHSDEDENGTEMSTQKE